MEKEICKICNDGKLFTNLGLHLKTKHNMSKLDYETGNYELPKPANLEEMEMTLEDKIDEELVEELKEVDDLEEEIKESKSDSVTPKEIQEGIFGKEKEITLKEFALQYNMTEKEIRNLVIQYKGGSVIPASQIIKERTESGVKGAEQINESYKSGEIEITDLYIAEDLMKNKGFKCKTVRRDPVKTWILFKKISD